jgi:two-component system chemotaxis response regulator CheY
MPLRAVVVDDSAFQRTVVSETIDDHVEIVGTAENGREAIKVFAETEPDLLTMDIMMPKLNGIEALSAIKERSPETTIVMVTSVSQTEKMRQAAKAGADGYVTKPFEAEELTTELADALDEPLAG